MSNYGGYKLLFDFTLCFSVFARYDACFRIYICGAAAHLKSLSKGLWRKNSTLVQIPNNEEPCLSLAMHGFLLLIFVHDSKPSLIHSAKRAFPTH
jgi:hypothetical protein